MIFLDVGAHEGQTIDEVLNHDFDVIHAFEPMPRQFDVLTQWYGDNPRIVLHNFGLADHTGDVPLYGQNDGMEASIYPGKLDVDPSVVTTVHVVTAVDFLDTLPADQSMVMKLNCEGAEVPILWNLIVTGAIQRLQHVMIDFDCRRVPGMDDEPQAILDALAEQDFDRYSLANEVMIGVTHQDRTRRWLELVGL